MLKMKQNMTLLRFCILAILLGTAVSPSGAAVSVRASVDSSSALVGDVLTYRVLITHDEGDSITSPPAGINLHSFLNRDYQRIPSHKLPDGRWQEGAVYRIAAFKPGTYVIPPLPVAWKDPAGVIREAITNPLIIEIKSLGVAKTDSLRGIKPAAVVPAVVETWVWIVFGSFAVFATGLVIFLIWMQKRTRERDEGPPAPVVIDEIAEFDKIPLEQLLAEGKLKELYILASEAMRRYIGRRYGIDAMEMTHDELALAYATLSIDREEAALVLSFLSRCDFVKFAKFVPPEEENATLIDRAKDIVRHTQHTEPTNSPDTLAGARRDELAKPEGDAEPTESDTVATNGGGE
jgi:hypothetical protein